MSGRKYYCFCDSNCKFETMTKEQILAAIAEAAAGGLDFDTDDAFISKVKESNAGGMVTFWRGTQAQYNALASIDPECFYIITDKTENVVNTEIEDGSVTREKLAYDALYSPNRSISTATATIALDMVGKTVFFEKSGADFVFTISKTESDKLPKGFEIAFVFWSANSVKIQFTEGLSVAIAGHTLYTNPVLSLPERYTMIAARKCTNSTWLITGSVEVVG